MRILIEKENEYSSFGRPVVHPGSRAIMSHGIRRAFSLSSKGMAVRGSEESDGDETPEGPVCFYSGLGRHARLTLICSDFRALLLNLHSSKFGSTSTN